MDLSTVVLSTRTSATGQTGVRTKPKKADFSHPSQRVPVYVCLPLLEPSSQASQPDLYSVIASILRRSRPPELSRPPGTLAPRWSMIHIETCCAGGGFWLYAELGLKRTSNWANVVDDDMKSNKQKKKKRNIVVMRFTSRMQIGSGPRADTRPRPTNTRGISTAATTSHWPPCHSPSPSPPLLAGATKVSTTNKKI